jgi:hypothetical protein
MGGGEGEAEGLGKFRLFLGGGEARRLGMAMGRVEQKPTHHKTRDLS